GASPRAAGGAGRARGCPRRRPRTGRAGRRSPRPLRKLDDERRAPAGRAVDSDPASVRVHDRLRDVEAEAGSLDLVLERGLRAEEALEQLLALGLLDPDPGV